MALRRPLGLQCEKCGSLFFQDTEFRQYYAGTYSSSPGGELFAVGSNAITIRLCLCGYPAPYNGPADAIFGKSLVAARLHRAQNEIEALRAALRKEFGSKEDVTALQAKLGALEKIVESRKRNEASGVANNLEPPGQKAT